MDESSNRFSFKSVCWFREGPKIGDTRNIESLVGDVHSRKEKEFFDRAQKNVN